MPGGPRRPLAFAWKTLRERSPANEFRFGLSRLVSFCTAHKIVPEAVDLAAFGHTFETPSRTKVW